MDTMDKIILVFLIGVILIPLAGLALLVCFGTLFHYFSLTPEQRRWYNETYGRFKVGLPPKRPCPKSSKRK